MVKNYKKYVNKLNILQLKVKKEKILIVSYKIPYPLSQGGSIAQYFFLNKLVKFYDISLCTVINNENQKRNLAQLKKAIPDLVVYSFNNIDRNQCLKKSILNFRLINLIKVVPNFFKKNKIIKLNFNYETNFHFGNEGFLVFLNNIIAENEFDIFQLEFFESLPLIHLLPKDKKRIFIHHEIRSKRNSLINYSNTIFKKYITDVTNTLENSFLDLFDKVVVFNLDDKNYLSNIKSKIFISPFGIPDELIVKNNTSNYYNRFLIVGSENHYPNKEGLSWFLNEIYDPNGDKNLWPVYITGWWSTDFVNNYKKNKNIIFTGFVSDLREYYENSVMLTPILSGSGIRTKILQSFANKLPVMSTKFASEGLFENESPMHHIIPFESEIDFLNEFEKMRNDMNYLKTVANNGFEYFSDNFDDSELLKKRIQVYLE